MKKLIPITVIFFFFAFFAGTGGEMYAFAGDEPPQISAVSAIVVDGAAGKVLYEKNSHSRQLPASTTKIMTALIALESGHSMDEMVEISEKAASAEGSSIYAEAGEKISFEDLMYALMLRSGNDAAVALAEHISGSSEKFAAEMNRKAAELGAENTNFVTVNGLHDDNHYTTAYDMALFAREAMKNADFRKIVSTGYWNASRADDKFNYFYNKNKVLYQYEGGNGIKIGYTSAAGRCLVASSQRNGMELIAVVFSAPDWFNDTYKLMDYIYENYESTVLIKEGEKLAAVNVEGGDKGHTWLVSDHDIVYPKRTGEDIDVTFRVVAEKSVKAPVCRGQSGGKLILYCDGEETGTDDAVFREDIDAKGKKEGIINYLLTLFTKNR
ncbi:MAG: D-alanyl-D-alanine carboxypeptidase family protein [Bacillota bacterium]|nr:D-alanyl-D-alanine carboxypeptidase family protein [Bacillota bacterium]